MYLRVLIVYHKDLNFMYGSLLKLKSQETTGQWKILAKSNFKYNQKYTV